MAQTKRKRRSKHRGNAAGSVEVRGRTGRQVEPAKGGKGKGGSVRLDRLDRPPTWRSAANRSAIATVLFVVVITLLQHNLPSALVIGLLMFPAYTGLGFYTDKRIYDKRQAKKAAGKS
ncbi:hypothetical protein [Baekduia sp.]|jgi:hypothetical protein|uniref:hypothetical protein n=1 Tax=Baekduia sp. TaxID=2600305 RepID=UPI002E0C9EB4|nr:hypothetical protein [Baekduia sp.]